MARDSIICGIDVGSNTIRTVIAHRRKGSEQLALVGVGESLSEGFRRGVVVDNEEAMRAIRESVRAAEQASGYSVRSAYVSVSGPHV